MGSKTHSNKSFLHPYWAIVIVLASQQKSWSHQGMYRDSQIMHNTQTVQRRPAASELPVVKLWIIALTLKLCSSKASKSPTMLNALIESPTKLNASIKSQKTYQSMPIKSVWIDGEGERSRKELLPDHHTMCCLQLLIQESKPQMPTCHSLHVGIDGKNTPLTSWSQALSLSWDSCKCCSDICDFQLPCLEWALMNESVGLTA